MGNWNSSLVVFAFVMASLFVMLYISDENSVITKAKEFSELQSARITSDLYSISKRSNVCIQSDQKFLQDYPAIASAIKQITEEKQLGPSNNEEYYFGTSVDMDRNEIYNLVSKYSFEHTVNNSQSIDKLFEYTNNLYRCIVVDAPLHD